MLTVHETLNYKTTISLYFLTNSDQVRPTMSVFLKLNDFKAYITFSEAFPLSDTAIIIILTCVAFVYGSGNYNGNFTGFSP